MSGFDTYAEIMAEKESSNDPTVINSLGYVGLYQMGTMALKDAGYIDPKAPNSNSALENSKYWTGKNKVESLDDFLRSESEQTAALKTLTNLNEKRLRKRKVITDKTTPEEMYGHLAGAHLLGAFGYSTDPESEDANEVSGQKYYKDVASKYQQRSTIPTADELDQFPPQVIPEEPVQTGGFQTAQSIAAREDEPEPEFQTGGTRSAQPAPTDEDRKKKAIQWLEDNPDLEPVDPFDFEVD